jgi:hypothetical protein
MLTNVHDKELRKQLVAEMQFLKPMLRENPCPFLIQARLRVSHICPLSGLWVPHFLEALTMFQFPRRSSTHTMMTTRHTLS